MLVSHLYYGIFLTGLSALASPFPSATHTAARILVLKHPSQKSEWLSITSERKSTHLILILPFKALQEPDPPASPVVSTDHSLHHSHSMFSSFFSLSAPWLWHHGHIPLWPCLGCLFNLKCHLVQNSFKNSNVPSSVKQPCPPPRSNYSPSLGPSQYFYTHLGGLTLIHW